jgi:hypothetical protein
MPAMGGAPGSADAAPSTEVESTMAGIIERGMRRRSST